MKKKINWLLILQGWAMLWVVIGHSPVSLEGMPSYASAMYNFAYSFHMPLFIAISGYLFHLTKLSRLNGVVGGCNYRSIIKDKLLRLGIPFLVFTFIAMLMKVMFPGDMARQTSLSVVEFLKAIINPFEGPLNELWFVGTILWFFAFAPLWQWVGKSRKTEVVCLVVLLMLHYIDVSTNVLCARQVCTNAVYFYLGILICKHGLDTRTQPKRWSLLLAIPVYALAVYYNLNIIATLSAVVFSAVLAFIADEYCPRLFSSFRNYTYQIYLIGIFSQIAVKMIYKRVDMPYIVGFALCIIVGIYVPVVVSKIVERINWTPLLLCVGLKKNKSPM